VKELVKVSGRSTTSPRSPLSRAPRAAYQEMKLCAAKRGMARCGAMPPAALASGATPGAEVSDYRSPGVLTSTAEWIAGWHFGVDWSATDYLPGTWLHVRALVFTARSPHGSGRHR
jgi:hypothetical protein